METEEREDSYSHILKYTGIFGGVQGLNILMGIVRNKFAALFLGPSGMGLVSLFNSTVSLIVSATNFGIPTSGVKAIAEHKEHPDEQISIIRTFTLAAAVIGLLVCALSGYFFNLFAFSWGNHTLHFVLLSPTVFFTILAGGETAVLKATGQLKALAVYSLAVVAMSLAISVPLYWKWGEQGIIAVLFLLAFSQWATACTLSRRKHPLRFCFCRKALMQGVPLLRLGMAFVLAGMMNSGAEFLVRAYMNNNGDLEMVGLFNAGVTIVIVYAGMIFSVMESDFYPRLSAIKEKGEELNLCVNRQLETNVMLIGPTICAMILALPIIIPLLYNSAFIGMLSMTQIAALGMLFRAVYLPIEYLPLSRGESKVFLVQESFCVVLLITCEIIGYDIGLKYYGKGLCGLGCGIVAAYAIETVALIVFSRRHYGYAMSSKGVMCTLFCLLCNISMLLTAFIDYHSFSYWLVGSFITAVCFVFSGIQIRNNLHSARR